MAVFLFSVVLLLVGPLLFVRDLLRVHGLLGVLLRELGMLSA